MWGKQIYTIAAYIVLQPYFSDPIIFYRLVDNIRTSLLGIIFNRWVWILSYRCEFHLDHSHIFLKMLYHVNYS